MITHFEMKSLFHPFLTHFIDKKILNKCFSYHLFPERHINLNNQILKMVFKFGFENYSLETVVLDTGKFARGNNFTNHH